MTDEEIAKLLESASPGPWVSHHPIAGSGVVCARGGSVVEHGHGTSVADARLIRAARTLVPELLARAKKAEAMLTKIRALHAFDDEGSAPYEPEYRELRALRAEIDAALDKST